MSVKRRDSASLKKFQTSFPALNCDLKKFVIPGEEAEEEEERET